MIEINGLKFEISITHEQISEKVRLLAQRINADYEGKNPVFVVMLSGAFIFAADLIRELNFSPQVAFAKYSSYEGTETTGVVKKIMDVNIDIKDRDVVIVEDIIDTGTTMSRVVPMFKQKGAKSIKIATMLLKPEKLRYNLEVDYVAMSIPSEFILGYGLDFNEEGRNFKDIYALCE
jgi:hypoxanthine phosphoribosyltransferase